jgi:hypothetical protein
MTYTVVNDAIPTGAVYNYFTDINASGEISGSAGDGQGGSVACTWDTNGNVTVMPSIPGGSIQGPAIIDSAGDVIWNLRTTSGYSYEALLLPVRQQRR